MLVAASQKTLWHSVVAAVAGSAKEPAWAWSCLQRGQCVSLYFSRMRRQHRAHTAL